MPFTRGFDPVLLPDHFARHGAGVNTTSEAEYVAAADVFLGGPRDPQTTLECIRANRDVIRYNQVTQEFGLLSSRRIIRTYFKPSPRRHRYPTNLAYYFAECHRT